MLNVYKIKQDICEIGRRIYAKGFAAANDGNTPLTFTRERRCSLIDDLWVLGKSSV